MIEVKEKCKAFIHNIIYFFSCSLFVYCWIMQPLQGKIKNSADYKNVLLFCYGSDVIIHFLFLFFKVSSKFSFAD